MVNRRGFFRKLLGGSSPPGESVRPTPQPVSRFGRGKPLPVLRPPGAVGEEEFLAGCTRCGECATACPHDAIIPAPSRYRQAAGTPMIEPVRSPCLMCDDTPCITACEPRVLRQENPIKMGTAKIVPFHCLSGPPGFCSSCLDQCPVEGAITLQGQFPVIQSQACTGCGVCQHVCPAPTNAVLILPSSFPSPPAGASP